MPEIKKQHVALITSFIGNAFARHNVPTTTAMLSSLTLGNHTLIQANNFPDMGMKMLVESNSGLIGIAVLTFGELGILPKIIQQIKNNLPKAQIVAGGTPVSAQVENVIDIPGLDVAVVGDGMRVWPLIVKKYLEGKRVRLVSSEVSGVYASGDKIPPIEHLDRYAPFLPLRSFPFPDLDNLELPIIERIKHIKEDSPLNMLRELVQTPFSGNVMVAIDCLRRCSFCINTLLKNMGNMGHTSMETRSISQIIQSVKQLVDVYNIPILPVWLQDPDIFYHPELLVELISNLDEAGIGDRVLFGIDARVDSLKSALDKYGYDKLRELLKGRFYKIYFAPETLDERVQASIDKPFNVDDLALVIEFAADIGAVPYVQLISGLLFDTEDSLTVTRKRILELRDILRPFILNIHRNTPIWGTDQYREALNLGLITKAMKIPDLTHGKALMSTAQGVSRERLDDWRIELSRVFYAADVFINKAMQDPRILLQDEIRNSFLRSTTGMGTREI